MSASHLNYLDSHHSGTPVCTNEVQQHWGDTAAHSKHWSASIQHIEASLKADEPFRDYLAAMKPLVIQFELLLRSQSYFAFFPILSEYYWESARTTHQGCWVKHLMNPLHTDDVDPEHNGKQVKHHNDPKYIVDSIHCWPVHTRQT